MYKGTIVENSLADTSVLEDIQIVRTWNDGDWILHDVLVEEDKLVDLQESLIDGPWFMHFWVPEQDEVVVIFRNQIFKVRASDMETWREAIEYGKSIGIPEEQLDFATN